MKFFRACIFSLLLFFGTVTFHPVHAQQKFQTDLDNVYVIQSSGNTHVTKKFTVTNLTSTEFVTKYAVIIQSQQLKNVRVYNDQGDLASTVNQINNYTTVGIEFSDKIVGKDQARVFFIEYDQPDIATITSQTADIFIPPINDPEGVNHYTVTIQIPVSYGQPSKVFPEFFSTENSNDSITTLKFSDQGKTEGITAIFGKEQSYSFDFQYRLHNVGSNQSLIQLPLPPDTAHQRVSFSTLYPKPTEITQDDDGNWIATYQQNAQQEIQVKIAGTISKYLEAQPFAKRSPLPQHTQSDTFWPTHEHAISQVAKETTTVDEINTYILEHLNYNFQRLNQDKTRLGPLTTFAQPTNALAQDFSDIFVSLARAVNIPSRTVVGYAFSQNKNLKPLGVGKSDLHSWAEYYNQEHQTWVSIDPTWQSTTGGRNYSSIPDLHRITFAIQGVSSTKPFPPGVEEQNAITVDHIAINEASASASNVLNTKVTIQPKLAAFLGFGDPYEIKIENLTGQAWHQLPLQVFSDNSLLISLAASTIPVLLPYQVVTIPFTITAGQLFQTTTGKLTVHIGEKTTEHQVSVGSLAEQFIQNPLILGAVGIILFSLVLTGIILYARHRGRSAAQHKKKHS